MIPVIKSKMHLRFFHQKCHWVKPRSFFPSISAVFADTRVIHPLPGELSVTSGPVLRGLANASEQMEQLLGLELQSLVGGSPQILFAFQIGRDHKQPLCFFPLCRAVFGCVASLSSAGCCMLLLLTGFRCANNQCWLPWKLLCTPQRILTGAF